jgi:ABC-type nitrate/sulfonate/bicarbonate transport system substrate-binding protein
MIPKKEHLILILSVCLVGAASATTFSASSPTKVVIAYSSLNERGSGALLVARDQGFFRKNDLDVHPIFVRSGAVALSALSAGEAVFRFRKRLGFGRMPGGLVPFCRRQ